MTLHIPDEFLEPESAAENQDPDLETPWFISATSTRTLRELWAPWMCRKGTGRFVDIDFFGKKIGGVPEPAVDAYRALESALRTTGYEPQSRWAYNCRKIAGTRATPCTRPESPSISTRRRTRSQRATRIRGS